MGLNLLVILNSTENKISSREINNSNSSPFTRLFITLSMSFFPTLYPLHPMISSLTLKPASSAAELDRIDLMMALPPELEIEAPKSG